MSSIHDDLGLLADADFTDLDPAFLDAIAGGSGGTECCVNPYVTATPIPDGTRYTPDCNGYRDC